ncbi:MAG: choice-of-anchor Q domain-containing protein, partial [Pseudomonadota bacterium]
MRRAIPILFSSLLASPIMAATINFGPNGCSLADAIRSANQDSAVGNCSAGSDTDMLIAPDGWSIRLNSNLPDITSDITLRTETTAGQLELSGGNSRPILRITGSGTDVNIQRVEFREGRKGGVLNGGGAALNIRDATVSILDSEFNANIVDADDGGAINIRNGVLVMRRTSLRNNWTRQAFVGDNRGGGIYARDSIVDLDEVFFDDNSALQSNPEEGGTTLSEGLFMDGGELTMDRSLVLELYRGIRAINGAEIDITNSTFEDSDLGYRDISKLDVQGPAFVRLNHVTMSAKMSIRDAILEGTNSVFTTCVLTGTNWIIDSANRYFNNECNGPEQWPGLIDLADNGGFTKTRASVAPSSVVDAGDPTYCTATDQRGEPRDANCDIGAYELSPTADLRASVTL